MRGKWSTGPEKINSQPTKDIEIKNTTELQEKLWKENLVDSSVSKYFEDGKFILIVTQEELDWLKQNYSILTLKKLLEEKSSVLEKAKKWVDDVRSALAKWTDINLEWADELSRSAKNAEKLMNSTLWDIPWSIEKASKKAMGEVKKEFEKITSKWALGTIIAITSLFWMDIADDMTNAIKMKSEGTGFMSAIKEWKWLSAIMSFFITDKALASHKKMNPEETTEQNTENKTEKKDKATPKVKPETTLALKDSLENKEKLNDEIFISTGYSILASLSGVEFKNSGNGWEKNIFNQMKNHTQEELQNILLSCLDSDNQPIPQKIKELTFDWVDSTKYSWQDIFNVLESLGNTYVNIIYKQRLNPTNLKTLLVSNEWKVFSKYTHLFNKTEIIALEQWKLNFRKLQISTVAILTTISLIWLFSYWLKKVQKMGIDSFNYITEEWDIQEQLKLEIENRKEDLLPTIAYTMLPSGSKELDTTITDFEKKDWFKDLLPEGKEKIIKFLKFKNSLLVFINTNDQINFWINNFKKNFIDWANLKTIAGLYTLLDWDSDFNQMVDKESNYDSFKKASTILWISERLWQNSKSIQAKYLVKVWFNLYKDNTSTIFSENDKAIFKNISSDFFSMHSNWATQKLEAIDWFIFWWLTTFLIEKGVNEEMAWIIARMFEWGIAVWLWFLFKKSPVWKIIIGSWIVIPLAWHFVWKIWSEALEKELWSKSFEKLNEIVIWKEYPIVDKNWTKGMVTIKSLKHLESIVKEPNTALEVDLKPKGEIKKDWVTFYPTVNKWLRVKYNGHIYKLDVWSWAKIDLDSEHDSYEWKNINMTIAEKKWEDIIIWSGKDNSIIIPMELVINKLKYSNNEKIVILKSEKNKETKDELNKFIDSIFGNWDLVLIKEI